MDRHESAVKTFLKEADFLGDADKPLIVALEETAKALDLGGVNAALVNQYRLLYTALADKGKSEDGEVDPLEALLDV